MRGVRKTRHHRRKHAKNKSASSSRNDKKMVINQAFPEISQPEKVNCSPVAQKQAHLPGSCYTESALRLVRDAYNKMHATDPVLDEDPRRMYSHLKNKLEPTCGAKENCWLNEISDPKVRHNLEDTTFATPQPSEWKREPNKWLSNFDLENVLKQYELAYPEFHLLGPTVLDYDFVEADGACVEEEMCHFSLKDLLDPPDKSTTKKTMLSIIFNLSKHDEPGTHWTTMFVDCNNKFIYYYDSALNPVPAQITKFRKEIMRQGKRLGIHFKYHQNNHQHQKSNTECGMYSLFFTIVMLTGKISSESNRVLSPQEKIRIFSKSVIPDEIMKKHRSIYFNN